MIREDFGETRPIPYRVTENHRRQVMAVSEKILSYSDVSQTMRYLSRIIYFLLREIIKQSCGRPSTRQFRALPRFKGESERHITLRLDDKHRKIISAMSKILGYETDTHTVRFIIHYGFRYMEKLIGKDRNLVLEYNVCGKGRLTFLDMAQDDELKMREYTDDFIAVVGSEIIAAIQSNYFFRQEEEARDLVIVRQVRLHLAQHNMPGPHSRDELLREIRVIGQYGSKKSEQVLNMALEHRIVTEYEDFERYIFPPDNR